MNLSKHAELLRQEYEYEKAAFKRDSQKGIIIGKQGAMLKKLGMLARKDIEAFFLEVFVKVDKDWRQNEKRLETYGYKLD